MSKLKDLFQWCLKALPVILNVTEIASNIAKHINDIASSFKKTSGIINDIEKGTPEKPKPAKAYTPNVMDDEPTKETNFSEVMTIINEHGKRLEVATTENKIDHNRISLQIKIIELVSIHSVIDRFVNNINLHAANLLMHAQSIENTTRILDDLKRHGFAIRRMLRVINYTTNKVNGAISGNPIEKLEGIDVEDNLNVDDILLSIELFEKARALLIREANEFVESMRIQNDNVESIREAARKIPEKAYEVSKWLNEDISPKLSAARNCVDELRAQIELLPPIDQNLVKQLGDYGSEERS